MKKYFYLLILGTLICSLGCAKARNKWASEGGFVSSMTGGTNGDYIVISQSGGEIMDVWKLKDAICQSPSGSDGWLFRDNDGNPINIGGDVKVIRVINDNDVWDSYHEYHMEFESQTYRQKYNSNKSK